LEGEPLRLEFDPQALDSNTLALEDEPPIFEFDPQTLKDEPLVLEGDTLALEDEPLALETEPLSSLNGEPPLYSLLGGSSHPEPPIQRHAIWGYSPLGRCPNHPVV